MSRYSLASAALGLSLPLALLTPAAVAQQGPPPVTVAKPVVRNVADMDEFIGRFDAVDQVSVRSRVGGYLDKVQFRDGTIVKTGDPLFIIDQRPFTTALSQAQASLEIAKSSLSFAELQFRRTEQLTGSGSLSVSSLDDRRREFVSAQASVRGAEAALARAQLDLDYTTISAPISGRIDRRLVSTGNLVQADQTILTTIVTLDPIDFYFDVDERRFLTYARTARGTGTELQEGGGALEVKVTLADSREPPVFGKLDFAENRVDGQTGTMRIRARFPNPKLILQPGLFGRVEIAASGTYRGILVPDDAIGSDQDQRVVYVVNDDGSFVPRPVRLGPLIDGYRVIRAGMTGDETIVVNGLMRLRPGAKVTPKKIELPPVAAKLGAAP